VSSYTDGLQREPAVVCLIALGCPRRFGPFLGEGVYAGSCN